MTSPYETAARLREKYDGKPAPTAVIGGKTHTIKDARMEFRNAVEKPAALAMSYGQGTFNITGEITVYHSVARHIIRKMRKGTTDKMRECWDQMMAIKPRMKTDRRTRVSVIMARGPWMGCGAICYKVDGPWAWVQFDDTRLPQHERVRRRDVHLRHRRIRWDRPL